MKIFLDDVRYPPDDTWKIVRCYSEFMECIRGLDLPPTHVSFDHDLGGHDYTGSDCARDFCQYGFDHNWNPAMIEMTVHSSNIEGALNIKSKIDSWIKVVEWLRNGEMK